MSKRRVYSQSKPYCSARLAITTTSNFIEAAGLATNTFTVRLTTVTDHAETHRVVLVR